LCPIDDRDAIAALVYAYAERLDAADFDGVADLFAAATFSGPGGRAHRGAAAVRRMYDRVILYAGSPRTKHVITNLLVDIDADGASSRCAFAVLHNVAPNAPITVVLAGRYEDRFVRDAGQWRFAARRVYVDATGDLAAHYQP
jgi:3-phenylpropionate/cinnamic acid dioxygenase small subunit